MFNAVWEDKGLTLKVFDSKTDALNFIKSNLTIEGVQKERKTASTP